MTDCLNVSLEGPDLLTELQLTTDLIAASEATDAFWQGRIDRLLGL